MKIKNIISVLLCGCFILSFAAWCFFGPKQTYSESERRALAKFPEITWENISTGKFSNGAVLHRRIEQKLFQKHSGTYLSICGFHIFRHCCF